jgi:pyrophosphatase PpaX
MKKFSCIIFDLDGTLSRTNELIFATFNHVAEKYMGTRFTPGEITNMFGPPEEIAIANLVGAAHAPEAMEDFYNFYETHHAAMATAYEGIPELLDHLKEEGLVLAVFTGKGRRSALITLERLGIGRFFDLVVSGTDVVNHKPSAEGIHKVMKYFRLGPEEVLMVGDAVSDITASSEAGVAIASVVWDSYNKDRVMEMNNDVLFHTVEEFSFWLKTVISDGSQEFHA